MIMIPSRMPIGRPYDKEMHAQRSDAVKDDGKVSKSVVSKKRIMMECEYHDIRTQAIGWRTPGETRE